MILYYNFSTESLEELTQEIFDKFVNLGAKRARQIIACKERVREQLSEAPETHAEELYNVIGREFVIQFGLCFATEREKAKARSEGLSAN